MNTKVPGREKLAVITVKHTFFIIVMAWCWKVGLQHHVKVIFLLCLRSGACFGDLCYAVRVTCWVFGGWHFQILETPCGIGRSWISCPADNGSRCLCLQWRLRLPLSFHSSLCVALRASLCLSEWTPEPQRISPDFKKQAVQRKQ